MLKEYISQLAQLELSFLPDGKTDWVWIQFSCIKSDLGNTA